MYIKRAIEDSVLKISKNARFADSELTEESTIRKFRIVQTEGSRQVTRMVACYTLLDSPLARRLCFSVF